MTQGEKNELRIKAAKVLGWEVDIPIRRLPNPLELAEDCEKLLLATIQKGRLILLWPSMEDLGVVGLTISNVFGGEKQDFCGDNPDKTLAYRESVTMACVAAWEAEQKEVGG